MDPPLSGYGRTIGPLNEVVPLLPLTLLLFRTGRCVALFFSGDPFRPVTSPLFFFFFFFPSPMNPLFRRYRKPPLCNKEVSSPLSGAASFSPSFFFFSWKSAGSIPRLTAVPPLSTVAQGLPHILGPPFFPPSFSFFSMLTSRRDRLPSNHLRLNDEPVFFASISFFFFFFCASCYAGFPLFSLPQKVVCGSRFMFWVIFFLLFVVVNLPSHDPFPPQVGLLLSLFFPPCLKRPER